MAQVQIGDLRYEWVEDWAQIPASENAAKGWAHPGMTVTAAGEIVTCHPDTSQILFFDTAGHLQNAWSAGIAEAHGITAVNGREDELVWITDNGAKADPSRNYQEVEQRGQVIQLSKQGEVRARLPEPPLDIYHDRHHAPTSIAVFQASSGGNGDIWVADGYGQSRVHCFDRKGNYKKSLTGAEGSAGEFATPHAVHISERGAEPELYISDRRNDRIQVYDLDGNFKRAFGQEFLMRPGGFAAVGEWLVIAELKARLTVIDAKDRLVVHIGANKAVCEREGWPNRILPDGTHVAPEFELGKFNSPHAIAADQQGNLYITEWVIGGRTIKLARI